MEPVRDPAVVKRMELAFELYDVAEQMMRQNLRRRFPDADGDDLERRLIEWLQKRPCATDLPHIGSN